MAEYVQLLSEKMGPELEQMEKLKLFDKQKIRMIASQRKEHDYKIHKRTCCKDDYLRYIQYESQLLKLVRIQKENQGFKKNDIDLAIAKRIVKLFQQVLSRFQEDVKLWLSFIKFCKQERMYSDVSRMLEKMLCAHSDKAKIWQLAASWEYDECGNMDAARQIIFQGTRFHPESAMLYTEAFKLELMHAAALRKKKGTALGDTAGNSNHGVASTSHSSGNPQLSPNKSLHDHHHPSDEVEKVEDGKIAKIFYESATKKIRNVEFIIHLLLIATDFDFTQRLQKRIVDDLLNWFPDDELTWDIMARRELEGLSYAKLTDPEPSALAVKRVKNRVPTKLQIKMCSEVYDAGVKAVKTEKMWSMYIDNFLELNQNTDSLPHFKCRLLLEAFQGAHLANLMSEKYYIKWVEILQHMKREKKIANVLRTATDRLPSADLFFIRLRFYLSKGDNTQGQQVFDQALKALGDCQQTLPLWKLMLQYNMGVKPNQVERIFEQGLHRHADISGALKPMYIEWITLTKGIFAARLVYDRISKHHPHCLELHTKMVEMEEVQPKLNLVKIRKCYDTACEQFGKSNALIWVEYFKFEMKRGTTEDMNKVQLHATTNLEHSQCEAFLSKYNVLKTTMVPPPELKE